ncbi:MAG: hypothetical protein OEL77_07425 [Nitrosopumilus sp.]|nr:hypothetical protein [Nitrosopumilus sp.]MDH3385825.1 hypothetical protein [Nitrosopumilus sp.]
MSSNYYRRGRNPTTAFGVLFVVIGVIALARQLIIWTEDFVLQFLFNSEINSEKVSVVTICVGIFIVVLGFRKNEQKR